MVKAQEVMKTKTDTSKFKKTYSHAKAQRKPKDILELFFAS
jgi:hypothetical protein